MEQRQLTLRLDVRQDGAQISLRDSFGATAEHTPRISADIVGRMRGRVREDRQPGRWPGAGLWGDLFGGSWRPLLDDALAWAAAEEERLLRLVVASCDGEVTEWPLELMVHPDEGLLGSLPWCRIVREPPFGWPSDQPSLRSRATLGRWRERALRRVLEWADVAEKMGRWQETAALLLSARELAQRGRPRRREARILARLAAALAWTHGERAGLDVAREAVALAQRARDPLSHWRALQFEADIQAGRGEVEMAEALLEQCAEIAARAGDPAAEADSRSRHVFLLFEHQRDREAVRLAPAARKACKRSRRVDLEARLDVALGKGALRHGHHRAGQNLLNRGARRLARQGLIQPACSAGTHLANFFLHHKEDELAVGTYVATLRTALVSEARAPRRDIGALDGMVIEGILAPLIRNVAPHLLRRRRPDALIALGLLLLLLTRESTERDRESPLGPVPPLPEPLPLVVGWCGRVLRLIGWVAASGVVEKDGTRQLVAHNLNRRVRRLVSELERITDGRLPLTQLQGLAMEAAHRTVRSPRPR